MANQEPRIRKALDTVREATARLRDMEFAAEFERNRRFMALKFLRDYVHYADIAKEVGLSPGRVAQIIRAMPEDDE